MPRPALFSPLVLRIEFKGTLGPHHLKERPRTYLRGLTPLPLLCYALLMGMNLCLERFTGYDRPPEGWDFCRHPGDREFCKLLHEHCALEFAGEERCTYWCLMPRFRILEPEAVLQLLALHMPEYERGPLSDA